MSSPRVFSIFVSLLLVGCTFAACSAGGDFYLRDELKNRGPLALSPSNPYLSPNLFIANEMKHSDVFRGFVRYRGTPDAIEVRGQYFKPFRVYLFYLNEGEAFLMERGSSDWLVRGPEKIPQQLMSSFFNMTPPGRNAPLAFEEHTLGVPSDVADEDAAAGVKSLRKVPTRAELASKSPPPKAPASLPKAQPAKPQPPKPRPPVEDPLASTAPAPQESISGDVIHRVSFAGESLRLISKWYTGDINNTGRIARINGIENADLLQIDQAVRIPRYLLKSNRPLTQMEVDRFNAENGN